MQMIPQPAKQYLVASDFDQTLSFHDSGSVLSVLVPIMEEFLRWDSTQIRDFFEAQGLMIQGWERMRADFLTIRSSSPAVPPSREKELTAL